MAAATAPRNMFEVSPSGDARSDRDSETRPDTASVRVSAWVWFRLGFIGASSPQFVGAKRFFCTPKPRRSRDYP
jgi:hypothetical protein